jgi:hypothetical protein
MVKRVDEIGPREIVELAREHIRRNLRGDLGVSTVSKAIGIGKQDLTGSYKCATTTTISKDIKKIRLHALYEAIKIAPHEDQESQICQFGLKPGNKLKEEFELEFWITIDDHRAHSMRHFGHTTHTLKKFSSELPG